MASITLIDNIVGLNVIKNSSVGNTRTLSTTPFPKNTEYFSFDFYYVFNDLYRSSPQKITIYDYMLIKYLTNVLYRVKIIDDRFYNDDNVLLDRKLTYFKINNIISTNELTIEWYPNHPESATYFSDYVKADFYVIPPRINVYNNNTDAVQITTTSDLYTFTIVDTKYLTFETIGISSITEINFLHLESLSIFKILPIPSNSNNIYKLTIDTTGMTAGMYELIIDVNSRELSFTEFENDSNTYNVKILIPYVFNSHSVIPMIIPNVKDLINTIDLTSFVDLSSVDDWSYYEIEFTYDGIVKLFDTIDKSIKTFTLDMLLKQLKDNVTCKFDILRKSDNNIVHTSANFTLVNQNKTYSSFELSPKSNTDNLLLKKDDQWIYMYKTTAEINFKNDIISNIKVNYYVYYLKGSDEHNSIAHNIDKAQLRLELKNKDSADSIKFDTLETFIFVDFDAFHTPTITPISNIHYFKEKKFKFDVSNNKYSFSFDGTPYNIIFKSRTAQPFFDINDEYQNNITITDLITEQNDVEIDILPYLFTHGEHTLRFYMKNKLEGVKSIYDTSSVTQNIISKPISIVLNVESDALVSCKVQ